MMGLGSTIGAGLFLGTGVGISAAGPAVLLAYLIAGFLAILVMQMLGEMGTVIPASGSFSEYAEHGIGRWAGFTQGWIYWLATVAVLGAEITGAVSFIGSWFNVSPWIPAAVCVAFFGIVNLLRVRLFGEFEYWFAAIKVIVIVAFLIVGFLLIFGFLPGHEFIGTKIFLEDGFMPNGLGGVAAGLLAVAFAFGGIEVVAIAAAESEDPEKSLVNAVRSTILRISVFYLGSVLVITFLLPYSTLGGADTAAQSPFTQVLDRAGIPVAMRLHGSHHRFGTALRIQRADLRLLAHDALAGLSPRGTADLYQDQRARRPHQRHRPVGAPLCGHGRAQLRRHGLVAPLHAQFCWRFPAHRVGIHRGEPAAPAPPPGSYPPAAHSYVGFPVPHVVLPGHLRGHCGAHADRRQCPCSAALGRSDVCNSRSRQRHQCEDARDFPDLDAAASRRRKAPQ